MKWWIFTGALHLLVCFAHLYKCTLSIIPWSYRSAHKLPTHSPSQITLNLRIHRILFSFPYCTSHLRQPQPETDDSRSFRLVCAPYPFLCAPRNVCRLGLDHLEAGKRDDYRVTQRCLLLDCLYGPGSKYQKLTLTITRKRHFWNQKHSLFEALLIHTQRSLNLQP